MVDQAPIWTAIHVNTAERIGYRGANSHMQFPRRIPKSRCTISGQ